MAAAGQDQLLLARLPADIELAAESLGVALEWKLEIVPGVGHDLQQMSEAAAEYLY